MAEECKVCIIADRIGRIEDDIEKNEQHSKKTEKAVYRKYVVTSIPLSNDVGIDIFRFYSYLLC